MVFPLQVNLPLTLMGDQLLLINGIFKSHINVKWILICSRKIRPLMHLAVCQIL